MGVDNYKVECWRKCLLCFMMIFLKDLYIIDIENVKEYNIGDIIEFVFLIRKKGLFFFYEKKEGGSVKVCEFFLKFIFIIDVELLVREVILDLDNWLVRVDFGFVDDLEKFLYVFVVME